eukprot:snap_masked-scaffold_13-processed-gene-3.39-mRNA-1 protein AED:1.00 eAED:1.00 QI:0/0/0/0/1/1/2/0/70
MKVHKNLKQHFINLYLDLEDWEILRLYLHHELDVLEGGGAQGINQDDVHDTPRDDKWIFQRTMSRGWTIR